MHQSSVLVIICIFVAISLSLSIQVVEGSPSLRAKFGESCNKSLRCDTVASLSCQNGTCRCLKDDSMTFDPLRGICVALAGEKCKFTVVEEYRSWLEEVACVQNSRCKSSGICACESTFQENPDGSCSPQKLIGEPCNQNSTSGSGSDCRADLHLSCVDGECRCEPEKGIFSYARGGCVGRADRPCLNDLCTANALCRGYYGEHTIESYEEYSGEDTKCICEAGYTMSPEGLCQVGYGGSCDFLDTQCLERFRCKDGCCACPYEGHQKYDETTQDCLSLVHGPCTPKNVTATTTMANSPPIYCLKPAVCTPAAVSSRYMCTCPEGTIESESRHCDLTFGRICQTEKELKERKSLSRSSSSSTLKCDPLAPLFCIGGKCQCADELRVYDPAVKRCRGLVGSDCEVEVKQDEFCTDGSKCVIFRGSGDKGTCQCQQGFVESRNGTCEKKVQMQV